MSKPKKEITLATIAEQMEKGFADMGDAFNKLADKADVLDTRMGKVENTLKGVQTHVALLENQVYDLRIEVQGVKRIVKPYDMVHKALTQDVSDLKKRVRVLEETKR